MNPSKIIAPYGSWSTPIDAAMVASVGTGSGGLMSDIMVRDSHVYWSEPRLHEGGRSVIMRWSPDGSKMDITPEDFNSRTRVHEYGGGGYCVHGETVYFSNYEDQRIYRLRQNQAPYPITPASVKPTALRYADGRVAKDGRFIFCVHERHEESVGVINELVVVPTDGSAPPRSIVYGHDFYASPRVNPHGNKLAWLAWNHPQMPWDGSELWVGTLLEDGSIRNAQLVAGGPEESISQPEWNPDGVLHFISDRTDWWNLYLWQDDSVEPIAPIDADLARPHWVFGYSRYTFLSDGRIACCYRRHGMDHLGLIEHGRGEVSPLKTEYTAIPYLSSDSIDTLWFVGGSFYQAPAIVRLKVLSGEATTFHSNFKSEVDPGYISIPQSIEFPTENGMNAFALYFPPTNRDYAGRQGEHPPLIVKSHGGPTSAARSYLQLEIQYWTSRGIAVVDVNYGGSFGYGRAYRHRLKGQWGVVDTVDCIHAARYLVEQGEVDPDRLAIRGGSAGGWSTLCALTFHDTFHAGSCYYGIADAEALTQFTHKFECRYLDGLLGPYPENKALYQSRSPINFVDQLSSPVIIFQGLEDKIVPPSQSEIMVEALEEKGLPYAYLTFEGEGHGFRRAETIARCLEAELFFYSRILNFDLPDQLHPVSIQNLNR